MNKKIIFRFDASAKIGAGHVIRSLVLANRFKELNWNVLIATNIDTYNFIPALNNFIRIEPIDLLNNTNACDILVIDSYGIDQELESQFRRFANKIIVIDDLANRHHDCDILIDQTYDRKAIDYSNFVSKETKILTGSEYVLIREDFLKIKKIAFEKRQKTDKIKKILVTMGGSDLNNFTFKALLEIEKSEFKGAIDIVLGFSKNENIQIVEYAKTVANKINIYTNANMPKLIYDADLSIGASGSGIWERLCLFLPSIIYMTADNQKMIFENLISKKIVHPSISLNTILKNEYQSLIHNDDIIDGLGCNRILNYIF